MEIHSSRHDTRLTDRAIIRNDRYFQTADGTPESAPFPQKRPVERKGREPAEDIAGQEQAPSLAGIHAMGEPSGQRPHADRSGNVHGRRAEREARPDQPERGQIHAVTQRSAQA